MVIIWPFQETHSDADAVSGMAHRLGLGRDTWWYLQRMHIGGDSAIWNSSSLHVQVNSSDIYCPVCVSLFRIEKIFMNFY